MNVHVGIDGGQTALRLSIDAGGPPATAAGFSWQHADPVAAVLVAVERAWSDAAGPTPPAVDVVGCGMTGSPSDPDQRERFAAGVADVLGAAEVRVSADLVTAHAGALPDGHGVALSVGTGVIALGVNTATGATARVDGWGYLIGDAGSAFAIGRAGLEAVFRAHDGRGRSTRLREDAEHRFGPLTRLPRRIYTSPTTVADVAGFAPDVVAAADTDPVSHDIVQGAAVELARTAAAAARVFPRGSGVPLACTGRLVIPGNELYEYLRDEVARHRPDLRIGPADGTSLDGASRLARLDDLGPYTPHVYRYRRP